MCTRLCFSMFDSEFYIAISLKLRRELLIIIELQSFMKGFSYFFEHSLARGSIRPIELINPAVSMTA